MDSGVTKKLDEFYYGIIAFGTQVCANFGAGDYAVLAVSAINLLIRRGEIIPSEKRDYSNYMIKKFDDAIGGKMSWSDINSIVNCMDEISDIDKNLAGIMAAIEMAR